MNRFIIVLFNVFFKGEENREKSVSVRKLAVILLLFLGFVNVFGLLLHLCRFELYKINEIAVEDIDLTDIFYHSLSKENIGSNYKFILINTGSLDVAKARHEIVALLPILKSAHPKAIGLDVNFENPEKEADASEALNSALQDPQIVSGNECGKQALFPLHPEDPVRLGYTNLPIMNNSAVRNYYDSEKEIKNSQKGIYSFARKLVSVVSPNRPSENDILALRYITRDKGFYNASIQHTEDTLHHFPALEASLFLSGDAAAVKRAKALLNNRIVILGHLGRPNMDNIFDMEDKHRAPTDSLLFNRMPSVPGAVIHANAVAMMLSQNNMREASPYIYYPLGIMILFFYLYVFHKIDTLGHIVKKLGAELLFLVSSSFLIIFIGILCMEFDYHLPIMKLFVYIALLVEFKIFAFDLYDHMHYRIITIYKNKVGLWQE